MIQPPLRFERRSTGVYLCLFHAGSFYWPVTQEAVIALKAHAHDAPDAFREALTAAVGVTPYLRHQLNTVLSEAGDQDAQLRAVQQSLAAM
jgi:hypothetical protein